MDQQVKKIFSVALSLLVGLGIIFFAWKGGVPTSNKFSLDPAAGGTSWKDSLSVVPQASSTETLGVARGSTSVLATTTSDIIAREMLTNYALLARSNATTTLSDAEVQTLAQGLVEKVGIIQGKQYAAKDLKVSLDNSPAALATYSNEVVRIINILVASRTKGDLEVAFMDPRVDAAAKRTALEQNAAHYEKLIRGLLNTKTPYGIAPLHLHLIQIYSDIETSVGVLADVYTDPIKGLAALGQYRKEVDDLVALSGEYSDYLSKNK